MAVCATCGASLPFGRRVRAARLCEACESRARGARDVALSQYDDALGVIMNSPAPNPTSLARLRQLDDTIAAGGGDATERKAAAYRWLLDVSLTDETLSLDEETRLLRVGEALFQTPEALTAVLAPYRPQLFIAMVNDGRLPEIESDRLIRKKGEVVHLEQPASLMKEVVEREFRSGSRGVSFRIMKGVSYRVGASRGRMVEVGRSWQVEDTGPLTVTSIRAVFAGSRRTVEVSYAKLIDIDVFADGIQFHVSNRQKPSVFQVGNGPMIAAAINAAAQKLLA